MITNNKTISSIVIEKRLNFIFPPNRCKLIVIVILKSNLFFLTKYLLRKELKQSAVFKITKFIFR